MGATVAGEVVWGAIVACAIVPLRVGRAVAADLGRLLLDGGGADNGQQAVLFCRISPPRACLALIAMLALHQPSATHLQQWQKSHNVVDQAFFSMRNSRISSLYS